MELDPVPLDEVTSPRPAAKRSDPRIAVSAITRARTVDGERMVRIAGVSARTALLVAREPLGWVGQCVELDVPIVGGRDLSVTAGIVQSERCRDGWGVTVEFMIVDGDARRQLDELLELLFMCR